MSSACPAGAFFVQELGMKQIRCVDDAIDAMVIATYGENTSRIARHFREALQSIALLARTEQSVTTQAYFQMLALLPEDCVRQ